MHPLLEDREVGAQLAGSEGWRDDRFRRRPTDHPLRRSRPEIATPCHGVLLAAPERLSARRPPLTGVWDIGLRHNSDTTSSCGAGA